MLAPLCLEPVTVNFFFPNFVQPFQHAYNCNRFRICIQLLCSLTRTLYIQKLLVYLCMCVCMCLPVAVSLSTFVCVLYAHLFADIFHRHRGREGVGSWLLRVCGIGSFVFPSNIFHSSSFQFTKMFIHSHEQFVFGVNLSCVAVAIVATVFGYSFVVVVVAPGILFACRVRLSCFFCICELSHIRSLQKGHFIGILIIFLCCFFYCF